MDDDSVSRRKTLIWCESSSEVIQKKNNEDHPGGRNESIGVDSRDKVIEAHIERTDLWFVMSNI